METKTFDVYWSPEGRKIATVVVPAKGWRGRDASRSAIRKAPMPYRKYLGELYAVEVLPVRPTA